MLVQSLPWALLSAGLVVLAIAVLLRQAGSRVARLFCAMIALVATWSLGFAVVLATRNEAVAHGWSKIALAAVALLPPAMYDFSATALRFAERRTPAITAIWVVGCVFALLILFGSSVVAEVESHDWGYYPTLTAAGGTLFLLFFFAILAVHFVEYAIEYRRTFDSERKQRLRDLMISFAIAYTASIDFLPMVGVVHRPVGYIPVAAFLVYSWRAIRSHRFRSISTARAAREAVETMADALFVVDRDARIRAVNPAVPKLLGYEESEVVGKSIDILEPREVEGTISKTLREMVRRAPIRDQERVFRHKNGELIEVSISLSPVREQEIEEGAVLIARDIRERKQAEGELREFTRKLQQSNRELEDFAYVASHDLQEPLRKIHAFGDRLREKCGDILTPESLDYLLRMQSATRRMQTLIDDLLTFSRVTTKAQPFVRVDLKEIADEAVRDLEARLHETHGTVMIDSLPIIDADPLQMRQLFQNLIGNALKFHRAGVSPRVEISGSILQLPNGHNGGRCEIVVSDNGIGFDQKYGERIFAMFERLHGRADFEGTGIGLAICRKIVQRHNGDIAARSTLGAGSTFIVTLPVRQQGRDLTG